MTQNKATVGAIAVLLVTFPVMLAAISQGASPQSQDSAGPQQLPPNNQTLKVDVDLVLVNATVTDSQNRYITGLEREHFQIWEDKVEQEISYFSAEDVPLSLGIIFDVSGSMKEKLSVARDAAVTFLKTGNPDDEYFLVEFSNRPQLAQDFTTDISRLQNRLIFMPAEGMTALYDAVYLGLEKLGEGTNTKKALLLITDGEDNRSRYTFSNVKEFVKEQDVQIYSIGIVSDWSSQLNTGRMGRALIDELTELTGGRAFFPNSVYELEDICHKIGLELKNQYVVGYSSTNQAKDGKWRKLQMKIEPPRGVPRLNVRSKSGYYAPAGDSPATSKD
jgi:Ca-activated chloride channel family protein